MKLLGSRLRALRESVGMSQIKLAEEIGSTQSAPPIRLMRKYGDYFDVSMDYIYGRCDDPRGKLYSAKPPVAASNPELRKFIDMCFDPESPMNEKLKTALLQMLEETK